MCQLVLVRKPVRGVLENKHVLSSVSVSCPSCDDMSELILFALANFRLVFNLCRLVMNREPGLVLPCLKMHETTAKNADCTLDYLLARLYLLTLEKKHRLQRSRTI